MCAHVGRKADVRGLNLSELGIQTNTQTGKIIVDEQDATDQKHIYAIGDVSNVSKKMVL